MLSNDVLLSIFDFSAVEDLSEFDAERMPGRREIEAWWQTLVHVCRQWRCVIFSSPRRLNLRLRCSMGTPRDALDVWPAFPFVICGNVDPGRLDNLIALLELSDRVCQINFTFNNTSSDFEAVLEAMQKPFPELTDLALWCPHSASIPPLPDSFLGGSAPRLRNLSLCNISFPGLPKLLLAATQLIGLFLSRIPLSGYISPDAMVAVLSTLACLESLNLHFQSPRSRPDRATQHLPSLTHSALPVLTELKFQGAFVEYLEDLVARIDVPQLRTLGITFFNQVVYTPQLVEFICRTPKLNVIENSCFVFGHYDIPTTLSGIYDRREFTVKIPCGGLDQQLSSLAQIFTSSLPPLSTLEDLYVYENQNSQLDRENDIEITAWLELLHPFMGVKYLYLSKQFVRRIKRALQVLVGDRSTEVLPALQSILLEGLQSSRSVQEGIGQFVAPRQVINHPITVAYWERRKKDERKKDDEDEESEDDDEDDADEDEFDGNGNGEVGDD